MNYLEQLSSWFSFEGKDHCKFFVFFLTYMSLIFSNVTGAGLVTTLLIRSATAVILIPSHLRILFLVCFV